MPFEGYEPGQEFEIVAIRGDELTPQLTYGYRGHTVKVLLDVVNNTYQIEAIELAHDSDQSEIDLITKMIIPNIKAELAKRYQDLVEAFS